MWCSTPLLSMKAKRFLVSGNRRMSAWAKLTVTPASAALRDA